MRNGGEVKYRTIVADPPWTLAASPTAWQQKAGVGILPYSTMNEDEISALPISDLAAPGADLYLWTITQQIPAAQRIAASWGFDPSALLVWCKPPRGVRLGGTFASNVEFVFYCRDRNSMMRIRRHLAEAARRNGISKQDVNAAMGVGSMAQWWLREEWTTYQNVPTADQWKQLKAITGASDDLDEEVEQARESLGARGPVDTRWFVWPRGRHSEKPDAFYDLVESVSPGPYLELFARRQRLGWDTWGDEALNHVSLGEG